MTLRLETDSNLSKHCATLYNEIDWERFDASADAGQHAIATACGVMRLEPKYVMTTRRTTDRVMCRMLAHIILRYLYRISLQEIGRMMKAKGGRKDHATIHHSLNAASNLYDTDRRWRVIIDEAVARAVATMPSRV